MITRFKFEDKKWRVTCSQGEIQITIADTDRKFAERLAVSEIIRLLAQEEEDRQTERVRILRDSSK